ncbi:hypothetical protein BXA15_06340 [Campylobacter lari]|uniref:protein-export chaperone SecB n=1 Tax=Campylobacter TaxID=194 RepID=UPI0017E29456|nr:MULTISPECIES: protein-export chaperone SecB [Campylobacter]EAI3897244.1 hypothetical protein [Campylobacter lari]EAJ5697085.1 hypothetical protein [Campylobacter lari]EHC7929207.1 hypothetical protein [Campylobacter lari]MCR2079416.1 protein-export chaperone SecB [Campylobacter lari subsp. concheus]MCV3424510.1 protein-export chaperone SecB [Campylobacter sp. IFREMER_LSEM_CL1085]
MNEIKSGVFQILSIEIKKFNFEQNGVLDDSGTINCKNNIGVIAHQKDDKKKDIFLIRLDLDIQADSGSESVYNISTTILSLIAFETKDEQNKILLNNAVAIMFSYLRPMIAQITMLSGFPPYHLQPVSFEEFKVKIINEK